MNARILIFASILILALNGMAFACGGGKGGGNYFAPPAPVEESAQIR